MQVPLHPLVVHFPLVLAFILPALMLTFTLMIKNNKMAPRVWLVILGLQFVLVGSGYFASKTGENEEDLVEKVVAKSLIHEHEDASEVFIGVTVIALVLSIAAFFVKKEIQFPLKLGVVFVSLIACYLAYRTGHLGGELVYKHGAASAYVNSSEVQSLLPTPGLNTSESPVPKNSNESLNEDENDYGNSDESSEVSDEDSKQED